MINLAQLLGQPTLPMHCVRGRYGDRAKCANAPPVQELLDGHLLLLRWRRDLRLSATLKCRCLFRARLRRPCSVVPERKRSDHPCPQFVDLGRTLLKPYFNHWVRARAELERAVELAPCHATAHSSLGFLLMTRYGELGISAEVMPLKSRRTDLPWRHSAYDLLDSS